MVPLCLPPSAYLPFAVAFGNGAALTGAGMASASRHEETMAAPPSIAAHVANIPGRKNLVWLTANLPFSGAAIARVSGPANIAVSVDGRGLRAKQVPTGTMMVTADADDESGASGRWDNMPGNRRSPSASPPWTRSPKKLAAKPS